VPSLLLALGAAELAWLGSDGWVVATGLEALAALCMVFRRSHAALAVPAAAIALMLIPSAGTRMEDVATPIFFYVLGMYSLGRYLTLRGAALVFVVTMALLLVDFTYDPADNDPTDAVFIASLAVPPWVFGRVSRRLAEQTALIARQSEQLRDAAVREERDRIARELHDVIAHSLSAMVVQTAAAQDLVRRDPDRAAGLLQAVADTGRATLAETGRLLHLIRDDGDELGLRPAPGLADVPELVAEFRDSGLAVDADFELPETPLAGGVDVSAYRVVQEALTNALKYADGQVSLRVAAQHDRLLISCTNAVGQVRTAGTNGSGLGLQGMAERVALLGGTLHSGSTPDARFVVDVDIPLTSGETT
jgi:signal transduction histidine kinase